MQVLIDTNVLLDICFEKGGFYKSSYGALLRLVTNNAKAIAIIIQKKAIFQILRNLILIY